MASNPSPLVFNYYCTNEAAILPRLVSDVPIDYVTLISVIF